MGGYGSGGWNATGKPITADAPRIGVKEFNRDGVLCGYHKGTLRWLNAALELKMHYASSRERIEFVVHRSGRSFAQTVSVEWEACRFGGNRPFFMCPQCNGRSLHLYCFGHLACRKCHHLGYQSQRERESDRAQRRANRLRQKLGGQPGWQQIPVRPRGMHQSTYERMIEEIANADALTSRFLAGR